MGRSDCLTPPLFHRCLRLFHDQTFAKPEGEVLGREVYESARARFQ